MTYSEPRSLFARSEAVLDATFLVLAGSSLMSVACAVDPLRAANRVAGRAAFRWRLVSIDGAPPSTTAGIPLPVDGRLDPGAACDLFAVIAGFGANAPAERGLVSAIYRAASRARAAGGIESGPWLLARAGLLDGRSATTHWEDLEDFENAFPGVTVRPDRYVIDGPVFSTGGASPTFDLMIELVRARLGPVVAADVASVFIYDEAHTGADAQPQVSLGRAGSHDPRLIAAIRIMEERLDRPVTIAAIARRIGVSARTLEALFQKEMDATPGAYFHALRLAAAHRLVSNTRAPLADIAERTGFASAASFSRAFRRRYGESPGRMRRAG